MTRQRISALLVTGAMLLAAGSAVTAQSPSAPPAMGGTLGLSEFFLKDLGQQEIKKAFESAATAAGFTTTTTDANGAAQQQLADVENLINLGVKAIVINPVDSAAIVPAVEKANTAGIPVFTIDRVPTGGQVALTVRTDNTALGKAAGEKMVELLTAKNGSPNGVVLEVTGDLASTNAQERQSGFDDVLKAYPDIQLLVKTAKGWDPAAGADIVRAVVSAGDPKIDGVYFHSEYTGAGIVPALDQLGQMPVGDPAHVIVVGIDGSPDGLKWIREGKLDATISQPLSDFGGVVVNYGIIPILAGQTLADGPVVQEGAVWSPSTLVTNAAGTTPDANILMSPTVVTTDNVDDPRLWGNSK